MSASARIPGIVLVTILVASPTVATAQAHSSLKPPPALFAADTFRLVKDLKAQKASENAVASAEAMYNRAIGDGLAIRLSPPMQFYIQAVAAHDEGAVRELLTKMEPFEFGLAAYVLHNNGMAQKYWLPLAQAGNSNAQTAVGLMYAGGRNGASQDDAAAFKWYRLAAGQGDEVAQEGLATLYSEGWGVSKDAIHAYVWLSLAAQQAVKDGHTAISASIVKRRDSLAAALNSDAINQALDLTKRCNQSQYKDCE